MPSRGGVHEEPTTNSGGRESGPTERTALLSVPTREQDSNETSSSNGRSTDSSPYDDSTSEDEIDPNEFDNLLSRSESYVSGLGVGPESQETAMLRGPRKYSRGRTGSHSSSRRRSSAATIGSFNENAVGGDEIAGPKSPFLQGVSVARFWLIFSSILISYFVACFDGTIMVSSHPVVTSYFGASNSASWLSTAFLLTSTSFQPLFGRLSDTIGRKPPYVFTTAVFLLATIWCALAQSMMSFIIARAVCGLGAGGMMTMGSIITSDLVPIEIRGAYQSYINLIFGVGSMLGAALGGAIADSMGWRWEFGIQVPALVVCLVVVCFTVPNKLGLAEGVEKKSLWEAMKVFDYKGSLLLTTSITFLILGLNLGGNVYEWKHPFVIISLIIFVICFPLFLWVESQVKLPIMPLNLVRYNPRAGLILSNAIGAIIHNAVMFNIPLFFQAVLLESATSSGLRLMVPSAASSLTGTATGFLITWTKNLKGPLYAGALCILAGAVLLSTMQRGMPTWTFLLFLIPSSMGSGFMFPATFMSVLAVSEQAEQAVVTSTLILWRSMGMVLGVASSSLVLQNALLFNLEKMVIGPDKEHVIEEVRKSVQAIAGLEPLYREQVIDAYAASLRATFIMSATLAVVTALITARLKLPKLGERK